MPFLFAGMPVCERALLCMGAVSGIKAGFLILHLNHVTKCPQAAQSAARWLRVRLSEPSCKEISVQIKDTDAGPQQVAKLVLKGMTLKKPFFQLFVLICKLCGWPCCPA